MSKTAIVANASGNPVKTALDILQIAYPLAFPKRGAGQVKPLKIGIQQDLFAEIEGEKLSLSRKSVRLFLSYWCRQPWYLKAIRDEVTRVDLSGKPCGDVTEEQKKLARDSLNKTMRIRRMRVEQRDAMLMQN